jgi:hypothetical protein
VTASRPAALAAGGGPVIGLSKEKRSIVCFWRGQAEAALRVLILAGQHGDERPARRVLQSLLAQAPEEVAARFAALRLAVIPEANPDGCAIRSRCNADGIDLNRDHQLLRSGEATAIHLFVRRWQPHIILDLHSYPSRRRHLLERNVVLDHDVFIDVPNHPAILARPGSIDGAQVLGGLLDTISAHGVRAGRYTIIGASGRARHSTTDVVDGRNGLALRYGAFTILVENRQPRRCEGSSERLRLRTAQEQALSSVLEWLDQNHRLFASIAPVPPPPGSPVPVHFKYADTAHGLDLVCRDAQHGRPACVTFPRYSASLVVRRAVSLPIGYAVPSGLVELKTVLRRHGFFSTHCRAGEVCWVEKLRIERARPSRRPNRPARRVVLVTHRTKMDLDRYEVFPTRQSGGDALAVFLEPESKHGLHRFSEMGLPLEAPSWYPVLRLAAGDSLAQKLGRL